MFIDKRQTTPNYGSFNLFVCAGNTLIKWESVEKINWKLNKKRFVVCRLTNNIQFFRSPIDVHFIFMLFLQMRCATLVPAPPCNRREGKVPEEKININCECK